MNDCAAEWRGDWGRDYTARNRVDWRARVPFWRGIVDSTGVRSVYEVGCNAGWNLSAIRRAQPDVQLGGVEINPAAYAQAKAATGIHLQHGPAQELLRFFDAEFDLVFTAGVLIHVPPAELRGLMEQIVNASADYVLAVEYAARQEEEVNYRGRNGMLWRRDYGELYRQLGLVVVQQGDPGTAFDHCHYWLLRKFK